LKPQLAAISSIVSPVCCKRLHASSIFLPTTYACGVTPTCSRNSRWNPFVLVGGPRAKVCVVDLPQQDSHEQLEVDGVAYPQPPFAGVVAVAPLLETPAGDSHEFRHDPACEVSVLIREDHRTLLS
jgi:hypothetical protein